jgi:all-trans-retinol 13,14-reductase
VSRLEPSKIRIGRRYRPGRLDNPYDALVIGSGIGGLTAAALLAESGRKVAVLEQHYTAGGYTHSYDRGNYEWDVGVHYIGDMGRPTDARRLFDFLTEGALDWAPMDSHFDRFFVGDKVFDAVAGKDAFRANLVSHFPAEVDAIDRYLAMLSEVGRAMKPLTLGKVLPPVLGRLLRPVLRRRLPSHLFRTTGDVLGELTQDRDLIAVLTGQWGDYGLPPARSAFLMQALVARHYLHGGYYPIGGSWRIAESMLPRIRRHGGEVFTYARVKKILVDAGRVSGVCMEDGTDIECCCVVSDVGVGNTFQRLLGEDDARRAGFDPTAAAVAPSIGHLGMYIGLEQSAQQLGLPRTNYWIFPDNDSDRAAERFLADPEAPFPVVFISFPSAKDPDFERRHPGKSTIEIVAPAPYEWFEKWRGTTWGQRGDDYDAFKERLASRLLAVLYERVPQLQGRVDYYEVSTPLSTEWFCAYDRGELYGIDHTPARFQADPLGPWTKIKGLWLTGQDTMSCGVVGAMMGGVTTFAAMAGLLKGSGVLRKAFTGWPGATASAA